MRKLSDQLQRHRATIVLVAVLLAMSGTYFYSQTRPKAASYFCPAGLAIGRPTDAHIKEMAASDDRCHNRGYTYLDDDDHLVELTYDKHGHITSEHREKKAFGSN